MHCGSIPVTTWVVWGFSSSDCLFLNLCLIIVDLRILRGYLFSLLSIGKPSDKELAQRIEVLDMCSMSVSNFVIIFFPPENQEQTIVLSFPCKTVHCCSLFFTEKKMSLSRLSYFPKLESNFYLQLQQYIKCNAIGNCGVLYQGQHITHYHYS